MDSAKIPHFILFLLLFIIAQGFSMMGQYIILPHVSTMTLWESYKMAIPFAWVDWLLMPLAINIGETYNLVTPTQDIFLLIIIQYLWFLIINHYYLKEPVKLSNDVGFIIILLGFSISFFHIISSTINNKEWNNRNIKSPRFRTL